MQQQGLTHVEVIEGDKAAHDVAVRAAAFDLTNEAREAVEHVEEAERRRRRSRRAEEEYPGIALLFCVRISAYTRAEIARDVQ